ncbi:hypothetical protein KL86DYS2_12016 [uncultured Dysgonomonas sp.]|uniref:Uncharacterized protein n=1 Tax=uncultured Dysgonomonas sp. TaxID=206096 RepID=A0A212JPG2_9BACT|nr:hypothetical protein KL86DYS2_12016 [uncultured Dysgonomonas sp.]
MIRIQFIDRDIFKNNITFMFIHLIHWKKMKKMKNKTINNTTYYQKNKRFDISNPLTG